MNKNIVYVLSAGILFIAVSIASCQFNGAEAPADSTRIQDGATVSVDPTSTPSLEPTSTITTTTENGQAQNDRLELRTITIENISNIELLDSPGLAGMRFLERRHIFIDRGEETWAVFSRDEDEVVIYDAFSGSRVRSLYYEEDSEYRFLFPSPDGHFLLTVSPLSGRATLWNLNNFEIEHVLTFHPLDYSYPWAHSPTATFSTDMELLAIAGCKIPGEGPDCLSSLVTIFELDTGSLIAELDGLQSITTAVEFSPDGSQLIVGGGANAVLNADIIVWDIESQQIVHDLALADDEGLWSTEMNPPLGRIVTSGGFNREAESRLQYESLQMWDLETWERIPCGSSVSQPLSFLELAPDGSYFVTDGGNASEIIFWNAADCSIIWRKYIGGIIHDIHVSSKENRIFIYSEYRGIQIWGIPETSE